MYSELFIHMCPESLITPQIKPYYDKVLAADERVHNANKNVNWDEIEDPALTTSPLRQPKFHRLSNDEHELLHNLNDNLIKKYISDYPCKNLQSFDEMFTCWLQVIHQNYLWFSDVSLKKSQQPEADAYSSEYLKNYWYFMEYQNDLVSSLEGFYGYNNLNIPSTIQFDFNELTQMFSFLCGYQSLLSLEEIKSSMYHSFQTAYGWAYHKPNNSWIDFSMPNSNEKTFEKNLERIIQCIRFVENNLVNKTWPKASISIISELPKKAALYSKITMTQDE